MMTKHPIAIVRTKAGKMEILARIDGTNWLVLERDEAGKTTPAPIEPQPTKRAVQMALAAKYGPAAELTMRGMDWFMRDPDGAAVPVGPESNERSEDPSTDRRR